VTAVCCARERSTADCGACRRRSFRGSECRPGSRRRPLLTSSRLPPRTSSFRRRRRPTARSADAASSSATSPQPATARSITSCYTVSAAVSSFRKYIVSTIMLLSLLSNEPTFVVNRNVCCLNFILCILALCSLVIM